MEQRPLAFDEQHLSTTRGTLDDQALGCAGDEVGDRPRRPRSPSLRSRSPSGPSARTRCGSRAAAPPVELERDGHLPDRTVRADGQDRRRAVRQVRSRRNVEPGRRLPQVAQLAPCSAASATSSGSSETNSWRPFSRSSPAPGSRSSRRRHAGGKRPPWVATPTSAVVAPSGSASATVLTTGKPSTRRRRHWPSRAARRCRRAGTASRHARSCRSADRPTVLRPGRATYAGATPSPGASEGS